VRVNPTKIFIRQLEPPTSVELEYHRRGKTDGHAPSGPEGVPGVRQADESRVWGSFRTAAAVRVHQLRRWSATRPRRPQVGGRPLRPPER